MSNNKTIAGIFALLALPISLLRHAGNSIRRKRLKAHVLRQIDENDKIEVPRSPSDVFSDASPQLSIITPIYNLEDYLEESITSVLSQSYRNFELIIIDDASSDRSLEIARSFARNDERMRVIELPYNTLGGAGIPSNIGLEQAKGTFVAFFDGDDILQPHAIAQLMEQAIAHGADLTIGSFKNLYEDTQEIEKPYDISTFSQIPQNVVLKPQDHSKALLLSAVPWRKIYKKSFLDAHKIRFPEGDLFFEDNPLHWDVMTAAQSAISVPVTVVFHRMNRSGQTKQSASPKLGAYFQHFAAISKRIQRNGGNFAWGAFMEHIKRAQWIIGKQTDPLMNIQFRLRFTQAIQEDVAPFIERDLQPRLSRLLQRFETLKAAPKLSIVVFHNHNETAETDLARTLASSNQDDSCNKEIIVVHTGERPALQPDMKDVIFFETNASATRSFNQAIQLCAGDYLAFLKSGDEITQSTLQEVSRHTDPIADILKYTASTTRRSQTGDIMLYGRRMVQCNAVFFGPTPLGQFSFDVLCSLYARNTIELDACPIQRQMSSYSTADHKHADRELGYLRREIDAAAQDTEHMRLILQRISAFFDSAENTLNIEDVLQGSPKLAADTHSFE